MRRAIGAALAAVLALAAALAFAPAAAAHTALTGSNPADGATVAPPSEIVLEFANPVTLPQIVVTDESDARHELGEPESVDNEITQPLKAPLPNGAYTVGWRAVSPDGHPITGTFEFTVEGAAPSASSSAAAPAPAPASTPADAAEQEGTSASWLWVGLAVLVVGAAAGGVAWLRRSKTQG